MGVGRAVVAVFTALLLVGSLGGPVAAGPRPITPEFFGVQDDRAQPPDPQAWGSARVWAAWCTVQPTAQTDLATSVPRRLGPAFETYAASGTRRVTVSLGHPAAWVFGEHPTAVSTRHTRIWYCQYAAANTSFPTARSLRSGPVRDAYEAYVRSVIESAGPYLAAHPDNRLVLQAWNEPNLRSGGTVRHRIPGAARSWSQAVASLRQQELILRRVASQAIPGRFEITSPSLYGKRSALNTAYLKAQARRATVDSISLNFYTLRQGNVNRSLALWRKKAAVAKRLVTRHKSLRKVPIWLTETNHNLVNGIPDDSNQTGVWALPEVQRRLVEVTTMEALRQGFAGLQWYQGTLLQTAVNTRPGTPATAASKALRTQLEGRRLVRCATRRSTTTCALTARPGSGPIKVRWSAKGSAGVTIIPTQP